MKTSAMVYSVNKLITAGTMTQNDFIRLAADFHLNGVDLSSNLIHEENADDGFISIEYEGEEGINVLTGFMNSVANVKTAIEKVVSDKK